MTKKPSPVEYDESIVQRIDYVPQSHPDQGDPLYWSGGFFEPGRRNSFPWRDDGTPFAHPVSEDLSALAVATETRRRCGGCRRLLPLAAFSPKPGREYVLRSRCDRCVERSQAGRKTKD